MIMSGLIALTGLVIGATVRLQTNVSDLVVARFIP